MTGITIRPSHKNKSLCTSCYSNNGNLNKDLPIWYNKGIVQYHLPEQLQCLREGEKLLIQQVAAYVSLLHLKMGKLDQRDMFAPLCKIYHLFVLYYQDYLMMFNLSRLLKILTRGW